MYRDFRDFLTFLERSGKLLRVKKEVNTRFDIAAGIRKSSDNDGPALLFENIKDFPGWRVAGGVYGTQKLVALAAGLPVNASEDEILKRYLECDQKQVKPERVRTGPVKEVIIKGKDVDLSKLPIPIYSELDSAPFLTSGVEIAKDPDTGVQNVSIHRRKVVSRNRTGMLVQPVIRHLAMMITKAEKKGQGVPVATVIGAPPELTLASQLNAPEGVDETYIAGAFRGAPLEVVKCETIDVEVPASAEIVIEGVTVPNERVEDHPFGEFPGNYITLSRVPSSQVYAVEVTAITMRKDAIFQALLTGMPMTENHYLTKWALPAADYRAIEKIADIKTINATRGGAVGYHLVVSIHKKKETEPGDIIKALFDLRANYGPKFLIVVDDDIDVYNPEDVEWALATRMRADEDVTIVPTTEVSPGFTTVPKLGIDATAPLKYRHFYNRITVPSVDKVDYL